MKTPSDHLRIINQIEANIEAVKRAGGPPPERRQQWDKLLRSLDAHKRAIEDQQLGFFGGAVAAVAAIAGIYTLFAAYRISEKIRKSVEEVAGPASKVVIWGLAGITLWAAVKWSDPAKWKNGSDSWRG
jgi:hypothetical protein